MDGADGAVRYARAGRPESQRRPANRACPARVETAPGGFRHLHPPDHAGGTDRVYPRAAGDLATGDRGDGEEDQVGGMATSKMTRKLSFVLAVAALIALADPAEAQDNYPSRAITMIVPFAAGGSTDVIGRLVAEGMRAVLGQSVVVDNRGGAGGSLGTAAIAKAVPDGYTIGMGTASTLAINPATYRNLPFDVLTDLVPVGNIAAVPNIMAVHPGVPAADIRAFITLAKSRPGKLSYASPGYGSGAHLLGEQFKLAAGP